MDTFRWIAVTFSMILGLGVTRVLSGAIAAFRSRHHAELDWIPFVWGVAVFVLQIQFWWAIFELPRLVDTWTLLDFMMLLGAPLSLFAAAALLLPAAELDPGESMVAHFERDGRWGLVCLAFYAVFAGLIDFALFGEGLRTQVAPFLVAEIALPLLCVPHALRRARSGLTLLYLAAVLWSSWDLSPRSY
jgi:hypothetical protein